MQNLAYKTYGDVTSRTTGDNQIEYALFQQITDALKGVAETEDPALDIWADAINRNLELWTALSADLLHPENALADQTKTALLQLAQYVRHTSLQILSGEAGTTEIVDLVELNTTIMAGLSGSPAAHPEEDAA